MSKVASVVVGVDLNVSPEEFEAMSLSEKRHAIVDALDGGALWDILETHEVEGMV